eukprot:ANDGO_04572.mRNA.1 hypothetical protein
MMMMPPQSRSPGLRSTSPGPTSPASLIKNTPVNEREESFRQCLSIYEVFSLNEGPFSACPVRLADTLLFDKGSPIVWYSHGTSQGLVVSKLAEGNFENPDMVLDAFRASCAEDTSAAHSIAVNYHQEVHSVPYSFKPLAGRANLLFHQKKGIKYPYREKPPVAFVMQRDHPGSVRYVDEEQLCRLLKHGRRTGFTGMVQKIVPVYPFNNPPSEESSDGKKVGRPIMIEWHHKAGKAAGRESKRNSETSFAPTTSSSLQFQQQVLSALVPKNEHGCTWYPTIPPTNASFVFWSPDQPLSLVETDLLTMFSQRVVLHLKRVAQYAARRSPFAPNASVHSNGRGSSSIEEPDDFQDFSDGEDDVDSLLRNSSFTSDSPPPVRPAHPTATLECVEFSILLARQIVKPPPPPASTSASSALPGAALNSSRGSIPSRTHQTSIDSNSGTFLTSVNPPTARSSSPPARSSYQSSQYTATRPSEIYFLYTTRIVITPRQTLLKCLPWPPVQLRHNLFPENHPLPSAAAQNAVGRSPVPSNLFLGPKKNSSSPTPLPALGKQHPGLFTKPGAKVEPVKSKSPTRINGIPHSGSVNHDALDAHCPNCDHHITSRKELLSVTFEQCIGSTACPILSLDDISYTSPTIRHMFAIQVVPTASGRRSAAARKKAAVASSQPRSEPPFLLRQSTEQLLRRTRGLFGNPLKQRQDSVVMRMHDRIPRAFRPRIPEIAQDLESFRWDELLMRKEFLSRAVLVCSKCCLEIQEAYWKRFEKRAKEELAPTIQDPLYNSRPGTPDFKRPSSSSSSVLYGGSPSPGRRQSISDRNAGGSPQKTVNGSSGINSAGSQKPVPTLSDRIQKKRSHPQSASPYGSRSPGRTPAIATMELTPKRTPSELTGQLKQMNRQQKRVFDVDFDARKERRERARRQQEKMREEEYIFLHTIRPGSSLSGKRPTPLQPRSKSASPSRAKEQQTSASPKPAVPSLKLTKKKSSKPNTPLTRYP